MAHQDLWHVPSPPQWHASGFVGLRVHLAAPQPELEQLLSSAGERAPAFGGQLPFGVVPLAAACGGMAPASPMVNPTPAPRARAPATAAGAQLVQQLELADPDGEPAAGCDLLLVGDDEVPTASAGEQGTSEHAADSTAARAGELREQAAALRIPVRSCAWAMQALRAGRLPADVLSLGPTVFTGPVKCAAACRAGRLPRACGAALACTPALAS